jgi:hypothetical protein
MLEHLSPEELPVALANLRARMKPGGRIVMMVTRTSFETKVLIEWCWNAGSYTQEELEAACLEAGFHDLKVPRFPLPYWWLNRGNVVIEATA